MKFVLTIEKEFDCKSANTHLKKKLKISSRVNYTTNPNLLDWNLNHVRGLGSLQMAHRILEQIDH